MGRCDQQACGQARVLSGRQAPSRCTPASRGYRKGEGGGLTRPRLCGYEDRGHPNPGVRSPGHRCWRPFLGRPGGRPGDPDLLTVAEMVQRTFPRQHRPDGWPVSRASASLRSLGLAVGFMAAGLQRFSDCHREVGAFPPGQVSTRLFCLPLSWWEKRAGRACDL